MAGGLITRVTPVDELSGILTEMFINNSPRVTKVSPESVLSGIIMANAKVAQKAIKDIALVESHLFPDSAFGAHLDTIAARQGIAPRFGASQSSTHVRIVADAGTTYTAGTHTFEGSGITFDLQETITIGDNGYGYAKVRSQTTGSSTKVSALSITAVSPVPTGHKYVINEYEAIGGRDSEDDRLFRLRIKHGANLAARGTIEHLTQVFNKINNDILRLFHLGFNNDGFPIIGIATHNGADLTALELSTLLEDAEEYLSITNLSPIGFNNPSIVLENVTYTPIDVSFRVNLQTGADIDQFRKDIQIEFSKAVDIRFWKQGSRVEWDDLLQIVKDHPSAVYVPDQNFTPGQDVDIQTNRIPRFRGFIVMDLEGNIIADNNSTLNPIYYPTNPDFSFQSTITSSI